MIRIQAAILAFALCPGWALAQTGGFELDLSSDSPKKEEAPPQESAKPSSPTAASIEAEPAPAKKAEDPTLGERDITQEDRVKSVQRKVYLKKNRFELSPSVVYSINDPYYSKWGGSLRAGYYLADTLALSVRGSLLQVVPSDDVRTAKRTFQSRIFFSVPQWSAMGDVEWSAIYGKVSIFNSILHFDGYLLAGAGVVVTDSSGQDGRGPNPAADLGAGLRFVAKDYLAVNVAVINTSYVDTPAGTFKGATQNMLTLNAGISLFLPLKSTGREAE